MNSGDGLDQEVELAAPRVKIIEIGQSFSMKQ